MSEATSTFGFPFSQSLIRVLPVCGCWEWKGSTFASGYGRVHVKRASRKAHRVVWQAIHGEIAEGLYVLHRCDNKLCVNPEHLFLGTHQENQADKVSKNRQAKGSKHGRTKLTEDEVHLIRHLYDSRKMSVRQMAKRFNVHSATIKSICIRETWAWLPELETVSPFTERICP